MKKQSRKGIANPSRLEPFNKDDKKIVNVIVETPMGSRNKFEYDENMGIYILSKTLPQGMSFPAAFGFVPSTLAADADPEDILVLMDEPVFTGCLVPTRLIGVIEASSQRKKARRPGMIDSSEWQQEAETTLTSSVSLI